MQHAVSTAAPTATGRLSALITSARVQAPTVTDYAAAILSSVLLILSFPDFNLWPLAWVGLVPLLFVVAHHPAPWRSFLTGWLAGTLFFYGSCHWLTYSMIHYGGIPQGIAYLLLLPGALTLGIFPGVFALLLAGAIRLWQNKALFLAPFTWISLEWGRLALTGQLWNAIGYSQAYHPLLIQSARWGGVYAIGFLILTINAAIAFLLLNRCKRALLISATVILAVVVVILASYAPSLSTPSANANSPAVLLVALQPNVPMDPVKSADDGRALTLLHVTMSETALRQLPNDGTPRLVIWPESPMNFIYAGNSKFQELLAGFARANSTSVLFNSQEPAPNEGSYNSALLVNQEGRVIAQYDKIRLLPFGEYVPLPRWLPGARSIRAIVGDFTPGAKYTLMPVGTTRAGVFICIESAYPSIARRFTREGADVLINISNDGYLGPTAVMRQHLANAIFRAVENDRPLLRVTNSGITAYIEPTGEVKDATDGFQTAERTWTIKREQKPETFYTRHGDVVASVGALITVLSFLSFIVAGFETRTRKHRRG
jgi:apolipoprotein N-acyltransferase